MRILQINSVCNSGSTGQIVYELHKQLIADGHNSVVCFGRGDKRTLPGTYRFGNHFGMLLHVALSRITGMTAIFSNYATTRLLRFMNEFQPDIVHLHNLHGYYVNMYRVLLYLKKSRIPVIWTLHDEYMYTGKCGLALGCMKWEKICFQCPQVKEYPTSIYIDCSKLLHQKKKKALCDFSNLTIVTPSEWLALRVRRSFLRDKKVVVIPNGIDTVHIFHPVPFDDLKTELGLTTEHIVLAVAPDIMRPIKGGRRILDIAKQMLGENVKFILVGVQDLAERFDENIIAIGKTQSQFELAKYYSMAHVFLLCSEQETFSLTCAEALACGTPVVGYQAGAPESVFQEPYAVFVEPNNQAALISVLRKRLAGVESTRCVIQFSIADMYKGYLREYRELYATMEEERSYGG